MFRRDLFQSVGGCRRLFTGGEDFDLWLRLAERAQLANLPEVLVRYRIHPDMESRKRLADQMLLMHWALVSADARRRRLPDPLAKQGLTIAELRLMDQRTFVERATQLANACAARANFLVRIGLPHEAMAMLDMSPRDSGGRTATARVNLAYARAFLALGRLRPAAVALVRGALADPGTLATAAFRYVRSG
jgi:hypothetical protein